ncbi:MAG TPA: hypothetical protein VFF76_03785 [Holophagaceae bacterium]|nr:hypothetical protein [Holophagaceae bacterium]
MKRLVVNGVEVGEFEASDDYMVELASCEALMKSLGIWDPPSKEMAMFNHAAAFSHAGGQIYRGLLSDHSEFVRGAAPFVVNSTFATEIYLKTLSILHGVEIRGHELTKLFHSLPESIRKRIHADYLKYAAANKISTPVSLEELLLANNDAFIKWRYSYELPSSNLFHIQDTVALMEALHKLGAEMLNERKKK